MTEADYDRHIDRLETALGLNKAGRQELTINEGVIG